jgi:hypothetical protein
MSSDTQVQSKPDIPTFKVDSLLQRVTNPLTPTRLFWITFIGAVIVFCQLQFWKLPAAKDRANWDYFAQVISRGGIPYRDVVNIKTPLSAYIGAAAILATRPFGFSPILATRMTYIGLSALTVAFTFSVANLFFKSRRMGLLAAMILCGIFLFGRLSSDGIQPKTPMILFGLMSLTAMIKDQPYKAGVFGMLSALSWQPGLLFIGAGGLAFSRYLTSWKDYKCVRLIAGALIPLALLLTHLAIGGALHDFYAWCFKFNVQVYAPRDFTSYSGFIDRFTMLINQYFPDDRKYFRLAEFGIILAIVREIYFAVRKGRRELLNRAPQHQVIIAALVYLIFCRIDMQGEQDLIPMLPFIGLFASLLLITLLDGGLAIIAKFVAQTNTRALKIAGCAALLIAVFHANVRPIFAFKVGKKNLAKQQADAADILAQLQPGDEIYVHGQTEMLVVSGLTNTHKYTNLDHGKDNYLDKVEPGGFQGWFERLQVDRPRIVMFTRIKNVDRKKEFLDWLKRDYEPRKARMFSYYVRKDR